MQGSPLPAPLHLLKGWAVQSRGSAAAEPSRGRLPPFYTEKKKPKQKKEVSAEAGRGEGGCARVCLSYGATDRARRAGAGGGEQSGLQELRLPQSIGARGAQRRGAGYAGEEPGEQAGRASRGRRRRGSRPFLRGALPPPAAAGPAPPASLPRSSSPRCLKLRKKKKNKGKGKKKVKRANGSWKTFSAAHAPRAGLLQTGLDFKAVRQRPGPRAAPGRAASPAAPSRPVCRSGCPITGPFSLVQLGVRPCEGKLFLQSRAPCAHPGQRAACGGARPLQHRRLLVLGRDGGTCTPTYTHIHTCTPIYTHM